MDKWFGTNKLNTSTLVSLNSESTFRQTLKDLTTLGPVSELSLTRENDHKYLRHLLFKKNENFWTLDSSVMLNFINHPESILQGHQAQALLNSGEV